MFAFAATGEDEALLAFASEAPNNDAQCAPLPFAPACALPVAACRRLAGSTDAIETMLISFTSFLKFGPKVKTESMARDALI